MKKKILATLLTAAMAVSLCACGEDTGASTASTDTTATTTTTSTDVATDVSTPAGPADTNIKIWVADNVVDLTTEKVNAFMADYPDYTVTIEAVGEGDAAGNMITDVEAGADIFGFAQDQLTRLVSAGALTTVTGDYATFVSEKNDAGAVAAATVGSDLYAFPMTSDNGYFLYYDKSVVTDPSTLEGIIADCEAAGKNFYMEINSAWYQTAFFFGTGCELTYDTDSEGNFTACNVSYASPEGVKALRAMCTLADSTSFQNGSSVDNATNLAAIVDGTWDSGAAQNVFGDNYACAKLPTFTVDGSTYQMGGFGGFKLMGVKPQTDAAKLDVCLKLAQMLTDYDAQMARFENFGWGPSNLEAQSSDAVKADPALSALAEQLAFAIPQGNYPGDYWSLGTSLGDDVINKTTNSGMNDDDLMAVLQYFQDTCISYAQ